MSRSVPEVQRFSNTGSSPSLKPVPEEREKKPSTFPQGKGLELWLVRLFIIVGATTLCYKLTPFGLRGAPAAGVGFLLALVILLAELRLSRAGIGGLLGGGLGAVWGMFSALLVTLIISRTSQPEPTKAFLEYAALFAFVYLGLMLGSQSGRKLNVAAPAAMPSVEPRPLGPLKLLDTSVLIDGRIADVSEAHFLDGVLAVPQFVLRELQLIADSPDSLKRQRGRRGLEVLERMQKMPHVGVRILEQDLLPAGDVDHKLVELARQLGAKIVTNDFNLNKVATVQGLAVLNVNQLANALKPVVLPGEPMRVLILREGKEPNQGVAYLDDGTMVVVDGARRLINKSVDIQVTSVHQTPAGKMIFGRLYDRAEPSAGAPRQAAAAAAGASRGESVSGSRVGLSGGAESASRLPGSPDLERGQRPIFPEPDTD
jgi:uncharacterized protein YacL